jgi:broad specificity phosphatase PhoE
VRVIEPRSGRYIAGIGLFAAFLLFVCAGNLVSQIAPGNIPTVLLVRHAEKDTMAVDPPLPEGGRLRAAKLATTLGNLRIARIFVSQFRRTQETAVPVSEHLGVVPTIIPVDADSIDDHVHRIVAAVSAIPPGEIVLIVSHSNVIPEIIQKLGVRDTVAIGDRRYDDLFIIPGGTGPRTLLKLQYGIK